MSSDLVSTTPTTWCVIISPRSLPETRLSTPLPLDHPVTMQTKVRFHKGLLYISILWYDSFRPSRTKQAPITADMILITIIESDIALKEG